MILSYLFSSIGYELSIIRKGEDFIELKYFAAFLFAIICVGIAVFQVLLTLGFPLGEATMGGKYRILPKSLRFASAISAVILLFMGYVFLQHIKLVSFIPLPTNLLVWVITGYLGLNTIANLASRSKKERLIMTPISSVAFILCLIVATS